MDNKIGLRFATRKCIEFEGCKAPNGYGVKRFNGQTHRAHRVAWMEVHGSIPEGMCVLHKCDNPPCININHLFLGTQADNIKDCIEKNRFPRGEINGLSILTDDDIKSIRKSVGQTQQDLADEYDVCRANIGKILRYETWRHVK